MSVKICIEFDSELQANKFLIACEDNKFEDWFNEIIEPLDVKMSQGIVDYESGDVEVNEYAP